MKVNSQCVGLTPGVGSPSVVSGTISTNTTWTSAFKAVSADITITSGAILTIDNCDVKIANDVTITVQSGCTLNIVNGTDMYGAEYVGGNRLWKGIVVDGGGTVDIEDSQIFYAKIAVNATNSSLSESVVTSTGSCFENNEIGIYFGPHALPNASNSLIENTEFQAPNLVDELAGQVGDYGVLVFLTDYTYGIQVGNNDEYDPVSDNYFHEIGKGIRSLNSDLTVQNCLFQDIDYDPGDLNFPGGTPITDPLDLCFAICATGDENISIPPYLLTVGNSSAADINNEFFDVRNGIYAEEYVNTDLNFNEMSSTLSSPYTINNGIEIRDYDYNSSHDIKRNSISYYEGDGIKMINIDDGSVDIENNNLLNSTTYFSGVFGIRVTGTSATDVIISANEVNYTNTGILVNGITEPEISSNIINFYSSTGFTVQSCGIKVLNCEDAQILSNDVTGNCTSGSCSNNVRGITIDESIDCYGDKNIIHDCSVGILLLNGTDGINLTCNEIHTDAKGVWFIDSGSPSGAIESPTTPGDPSDNGWYDETTAERVRAQRTGGGTCDLLDLDWYFDDDETWSDIPTGLTVAVAPAVLPTFNLTTGDYCDQPLRTDGSENDFDVLSYYFGSWADDVAENGFSENLNNYYTAWNYWDYLKYDIELQSILEGNLENAFELVLESNIPIFDEVRSMPGNSYWEAAVELNNSITPINEVENIIQETNTIYYNNMDECGKLILSGEDETRLREIAILPGFDYGFGVYNAWKMLDTVINIDLIDDEKFGSISATNKLILYPNPAGNYFYVEVSLNEKLFNVIVYNIDGRELMTFNNVHEQLPLDITQLPSGVYNVKAKTQNNGSYWSKLVIFKPNK